MRAEREERQKYKLYQAEKVKELAQNASESIPAASPEEQYQKLVDEAHKEDAGKQPMQDLVDQY